MRVKWILAALLAALMAATGTALAELIVDVYIAEGCMPREQALQLVQLMEDELERENRDVRFVLAREGETLRDLILSDHAPQIAICSLQETAAWAQEGLLLPLDGCLTQDAGIAQAVLAACRCSGRLMTAPLRARSRQMAVNRALLDTVQMGYLLNTREYPVWTPMQLLQVLDEMALSGKAAMEFWPSAEDGCGAMLALAQSLYGGLLFSEDGQTLLPGGAAEAGLAFIADMIDAGMIVQAENRETALLRFAAGESAIFADWTQEDAAVFAHALPFDMMVVPYPAASGIPVHAFDLVVASAFSSGERQWDALGIEAISFLMENPQAQLLLGERGIFEDDALWLLPPGAEAFSPGVYSALCSAMDALLHGQADADAALGMIASCAGKDAR